MADKKLNSLAFPNLPDRYILDAGHVKYSDSDTYAGGTVGKALQEKSAGIENLVTASAVQTLENKVPYLFRQTPNAGHNELDTIVGGTVAWNQLVYVDENGTSAGVTLSTDSGHKTVTINGTTTSTLYLPLTVRLGYTSLVNHIYLCDKGASAPSHCFIYNDNGGVAPADAARAAYIGKATAERAFYIRSESGNTFNNVSITPQIFDLTQMFGSTVADAIYAMEQATAGSGVAYFKALFGEDYYPYSSGELKSVEGVSAHVMRDANENIIGSYALDSSLTLRGIPKLDANNNLYYDGDVYEADGTVTRKYEVIDLSTLTWSTVSGTVKYGPISAGQKEAGLAISEKYQVFTSWGAFQDSSNTAPSVFVGETAFFTNNVDAPSGLAVYELATPTTETAQSYQYAQACDPNGTEEYVTTGIVPVGHDTKYPITLSDIMPASNGNYVLKCTVTGGVATYEWVSES